MFVFLGVVPAMLFPYSKMLSRDVIPGYTLRAILQNGGPRSGFTRPDKETQELPPKSFNTFRYIPHLKLLSRSSHNSLLQAEYAVRLPVRGVGRWCAEANHLTSWRTHRFDLSTRQSATSSQPSTLPIAL